jgi:hypothetical protein
VQGQRRSVSPCRPQGQQFVLDGLWNDGGRDALNKHTVRFGTVMLNEIDRYFILLQGTLQIDVVLIS